MACPRPAPEIPWTNLVFFVAFFWGGGISLVCVFVDVCHVLVQVLLLFVVLVHFLLIVVMF